MGQHRNSVRPYQREDSTRMGGGAGCRSTYATGAGGVGGAGWALVLEF